MKNSYISLEEDPSVTLSQVPNRVLHVYDIYVYIHYKFESIGDTNIHHEMNLVENKHLTLN